MKKSLNPKISVIMSVYNGMPYLNQAVDSILNQTYKNIEFIIINDASNDSSWGYLKSLKDKRIKLFNNSSNLGLASSLNIALQKTTGSLIARMDADDISLSNRISEQVRFFKNHKQVDICGSWATLIDQNGKIIGQKKYPTTNFDIKNNLAWYPPIIHPSMMIKKSVFNLLRGYNPDFDTAEDYELLMRAKKKYIMANIPKILFKWRLWDKRRSRLEMSKMNEIDLKVKIDAYRRGDFGFSYLSIIAYKFIMTYLVPFSLKVKIAKFLKLA